MRASAVLRRFLQWRANDEYLSKFNSFTTVANTRRNHAQDPGEPPGSLLVGRSPPPPAPRQRLKLISAAVRGRARGGSASRYACRSLMVPMGARQGRTRAAPPTPSTRTNERQWQGPGQLYSRVDVSSWKSKLGAGLRAPRLGSTYEAVLVLICSICSDTVTLMVLRRASRNLLLPDIAESYSSSAPRAHYSQIYFSKIKNN